MPPGVKTAATLGIDHREVQIHGCGLTVNDVMSAFYGVPGEPKIFLVVGLTIERVFDMVWVLVFPERYESLSFDVGVSWVCVVDLVRTLEALDPAALDRDGVKAALVSVGRVQSWLDACQARLVRRLDQLAEDNPAAPPPEVDVAAATRGSRSEASRASRRARALGVVPEVEAALGHRRAAAGTQSDISSGRARSPLSQV